MKISEVRIVPVAEVCDRRRTDPKNPSGCSTIAAFVRKPQIEPVTPTPANQAQSSLIKPNQTISCLDAIHSQPPWGLWFGVWCLICASTRSSVVLPLRPHHPPRMPSTDADQIRIRQSAISVSLRQSQSKPVKAFSNRYLRATVPAATTIYGGLPSQMHNQLRFTDTAHTNSAMQSAFPVKPGPISPFSPIRPIRPILEFRKLPRLSEAIPSHSPQHYSFGQIKLNKGG